MKALKFIAAIMFLVFAISASYAQTYYMANLMNSSQSATVTVNGYPLVTSSQLQDVSSSAPMNLWIWKGANTVKIHLEARDSKHSPSLSVAIIKQTSDQKETSLVKFVYPAKNEKPVYPYDKTITFDLADDTPSGFWGEAEPIVLDNASKSNAGDIVVQIFNAFQKKDLKKLHELRDYQLKDMAKTFGQNVENLSKSFDEDITEAFGSKDFKPVPFKKDDLNFNLLENGKVIMITLKDGTTPLSFGSFSIKDVFIGKVKGKYLLVR